MILTASVAIIGVLNHSSEESPAIPKRVPPSQRPERKLDDVARAIASLVEETKAAKSADHGRASSADLQANGSPKGITKPANAQPSVPTMKRRKTGGG